MGGVATETEGEKVLNEDEGLGEICVGGVLKERLL
jgi:hypothetical protein